MKRLFLVFGTAVMILPWFAAARLQADMIQWTASGNPLGPNLNPSSGTAGIGSLNFGAGGISLSPAPTTSGTNSGSVIALQVGYWVNPWNSAGIPTFGGPSANYSLSLTLHDNASGTFGSLIFRGSFSGQFIEGFPALTNTYLGPTTQTLKLGQNLYTVTMEPYVNGTEVGSGEGSISASISVQPSVNSTSEPSSLLLACLGLAPLGLTRWLRRRRKDVDSNA